ncbi:MAG: hypothetical protein ACXVW1_06260 [Nocardioides sp.]
MSARRVPRGLAVLAVVALLPLAGCQSRQDSYCSAVKDHQADLSSIVDSGSKDALLQALPIFQDLQDKAPSDVSDEWQQLVSRVQALQDALRQAGVDPATYDRDKPPAGLSAADKAAIDAASKQLGGGETLAAYQAIDQEVRDVCQTSLTI